MVLHALLLLSAALRVAVAGGRGTPVNLVFIMADDLGYGDLADFGGHPTSETPALDQLAAEGMRFLSMYSSSPVCSPSRSSVMTGRFMTRNGVWPGVFSPGSTGGLALNESTLPTLLRNYGYETFMAGKWHLGVGEHGEYLPYNRGFDHYYGEYLGQLHISFFFSTSPPNSFPWTRANSFNRLAGVPYGIDMCSQLTVMDIERDGHPAGACFAPNVSCKAAQYVGGQVNFGGRENETPCPFYVNATIMEQPTALLTIDDKYVAATTAFIRNHGKDGKRAAAPFFVYFASHHTHTPAFAKANFSNTSIRGWFGDHLRTLDWSVGAVVQSIKDGGLASRTLVMFSADNGPSLTWEDLGGTNGNVRCGKGTTWEGGQRVPSIAWWPGVVGPATVSRAMASSMDFFATALDLAGVPLPEDRTIDAVSFAGILRNQHCGANGQDVSNRSTFYYWGKNPSPKVGLHAVRHSTPTFGDWKLHWVTEGSHCNDDYPDKECPQSRGLRVLAPQDWLLYNLDISPGETRNLSLAAYPNVVAKLTALKGAHEAEPDVFGPSEVARGANQSFEPCAPEARATGCAPPGAVHPTWPELPGYVTEAHTLGGGTAYRTHDCTVLNTTESALTCQRTVASMCRRDVLCAGFSLCDWNAQCSQEPFRGVAQLFTAAQLAKASSDRPFWTTWVKHSTASAASRASSWPLCCQKEWGGNWTKDIGLESK